MFKCYIDTDAYDAFRAARPHTTDANFGFFIKFCLLACGKPIIFYRSEQFFPLGFRCGPPSCMLIKTAFLQLVSETLHACMHAFLSVFGIKNSLGSGRIRLPSPYFLHMNVDHLTSIIVLWFNQVKTKLTEQPKCKFISRLG